MLCLIAPRALRAAEAGEKLGHGLGCRGPHKPAAEGARVRSLFSADPACSSGRNASRSRSPPPARQLGLLRLDGGRHAHPAGSGGPGRGVRPLRHEAGRGARRASAGAPLRLLRAGKFGEPRAIGLLRRCFAPVAACSLGTSQKRFLERKKQVEGRQKAAAPVDPQLQLLDQVRRREESRGQAEAALAGPQVGGCRKLQFARPPVRRS